MTTTVPLQGTKSTLSIRGESTNLILPLLTLGHFILYTSGDFGGIQFSWFEKNLIEVSTNSYTRVM